VLKTNKSREPSNCQHCAGAILRDGRTKFGCTRCGSMIIVPPAGGEPKPVKIAGRALVISSDNLPNRWGIYPFLTESVHEPLLQRFRAEFPFERAFKGAKDEFDGLVNLRHLLRDVWLPSRPKPAFLKKYGFWQSNRLNQFWFCTHFSRMFVMSATALGIPARVINVAKGVKLNEDCKGHMVADIWSDQYQKWVYMDPLFDFHYENEDGEPLDLLEARALFWRKGGKGLFLSTLRNTGEYVPGRHYLGEKNPGELVKGLRERTLNTFWCLFFHGQNFFTQPLEDRRTRILIYEDEMTKGNRLLGGGYEHYADEPPVVRTPDPLDLYPTMNNAEIQLYRTPQDGDAGLRVYIATTTPNLKRVRYRINGGAWRNYAVDGFLLPLTSRKTTVEAFTQNYAGRQGRTSVVEARTVGRQ